VPRTGTLEAEMHRPRLLIALPVAAMLMLSVSAAKAASLTFSPTGLEGGGFQNVVAVDPSDPTILLSGGDVSGIERSTDAGASWQAVNAGLTGRSQLEVSAFLFSPVVAGRVYAAVGDAGAGGGLLQSDDSGATWTMLSTVPQFAGGNAKTAGLPAEHPRSTGNLIAQDPVTGSLYVATFKQGVLRSDDGGASWVPLGMAGLYLRALALDPAAPGVLYAGSYGAGLYRTTDAGGQGGFTQLAGGAPSTGEELAIAGGSIYAAAGTAGVFKSSDQGATWQSLGAGQLQSGSMWTSIAAWQGCDGNTVIYAGADQSSPNAIVRSPDGGASWASVTADASHVHANVGGPLGQPWWLSTRSAFMLGGKSSTPAQITIDPDPTDACAQPKVLVAGRSGIWQSANAGGDWYPMVGQMGVTVVQTLALDPSSPGAVDIAATDWTFLTSSNAAAGVSSPAIKLAASTGFDVAIDPWVSPSRVYIATGNRDGNRQGRIYSSTTPAVGSSWKDEGLSALAGAKRPLAIAVGKTAAGAHVLLAAVDAGGIYRKVGTSWTRAASTAMTTKNWAKPIQMIWPAGTQTVYLYDHRSGTWRSADAGQTWVKLWAKPSTGDLKGYIATDATGATLWVSTGTALYRIDNARTGTVAAGTLTPLTVLTAPLPGPVAVSSTGSVYLALQPSGGVAAQLLRSDDRGATWTDVADATYRATALLPFRLVSDASGGIWVCLAGNGLLHGVPGP
jgi:hypothetical protein